MRDFLIPFLTAGISSMGFGIYFQIKSNRIYSAAIAGFLSFSIYYIILNLTGSIFFSNFMGALAAFIYSELLARILKAPANVFLIPSLIPLLPGGNLFYTMQTLMNSEKEAFYYHGSQTLLTILGLTVGIVILQPFLPAILKTRKKITFLRNTKNLH